MERESASANVKKEKEVSCDSAVSLSSANEVDDRVVVGGQARDARSVSFLTEAENRETGTAGCRLVEAGGGANPGGKSPTSLH